MKISVANTSNNAFRHMPTAIMQRKRNVPMIWKFWILPYTPKEMILFSISSIRCNIFRGICLIWYISQWSQKRVSKERQDVHLLTRNKLLKVLYVRLYSENSHPAGNYMFEVNNKNTKRKCEICSKLTIKTTEQCQWRQLLFLNILHTLF